MILIALFASIPNFTLANLGRRKNNRNDPIYVMLPKVAQTSTLLLQFDTKTREY